MQTVPKMDKMEPNTPVRSGKDRRKEERRHEERRELEMQLAKFKERRKSERRDDENRRQFLRRLQDQEHILKASKLEE